MSWPGHATVMHAVHSVRQKSSETKDQKEQCLFVKHLSCRGIESFLCMPIAIQKTVDTAKLGENLKCVK